MLKWRTRILTTAPNILRDPPINSDLQLPTSISKRARGGIRLPRLFHRPRLTLQALLNQLRARTGTTPLIALQLVSPRHALPLTQHQTIHTIQHLVSSLSRSLSLSLHLFQDLPSDPHVLTSLILANARQPPLHLPPIQPINPSPDHYYPSSATAQLNAVFGRETKSPRQMRPTYSGAPGESTRGPVPTFTSLRSLNELQPRINPQPAYRRADPEGGFISPLQALTTQLPSTYRICNPQFKYESSRNPRRVLTKPSKGVKNDGFDNEDSDYILYVNDILGNEDNGHKNRYLILDVLGQGTFGQVVKCQNLKTQEVVAVKVVKNRTAYFNQSMMEVSVLDLVCCPFFLHFLKNTDVQN